MRERDRLLLIELVDEALKHLPKEGVKGYELWNSVPSFRRIKRIDAYCFEKRRSPRTRRSEDWLDLQANNYEKQK
jgi:hypothetical protein